MKKTVMTAAFVGATALAMPAAAATIGAGATFCESLNENVARGIFAASDCDAGGNPDWSNNSNNPSALTVNGSATVLGFVKDNGDTGTGKYPDYANITLSEKAQVTVTLVEPDTGFDALLTWTGNGTAVSEVLNGQVGTFSFLVEAGTYLFGLDATTPTDQNFSTSSAYTIGISAVPLPAGLVLLLTGMGGLAAMRRRKTA